MVSGVPTTSFQTFSTMLIDTRYANALSASAISPFSSAPSPSTSSLLKPARNDAAMSHIEVRRPATLPSRDSTAAWSMGITSGPMNWPQAAAKPHGWMRRVRVATLVHSSSLDWAQYNSGSPDAQAGTGLVAALICAAVAVAQSAVM